VQVVCPNCGEPFELSIDPEETELITDCETCCRPMTVNVRVVDGEIEGVDVSPS
jgi:hypothetical protein